jgi:hypothetical protein
MLIKIATVGTSAAGRTYARDLLGRTFFPQTKDMEIKKGEFAFAIETTQTMTTDEDGNLVKLDEPRKIWQITATFPDKQSAVEAAAEAGTMELAVTAEVHKTAKALGLSDEAVKALANAIP